MDSHRIQVIRDAELTDLATEPAYRPENLAHWTGLKMARFRLPAERLDRHVRADHPIITLMCSGQAENRLRIGLQETHSQYRAFDMMCYSGGREIQSAQWHSKDAMVISVELDPARLAAVDSADTRFAEQSLQGTPRFTDPDLAAVVLALWKEVYAGCPQGKLYTDSLCLGLTSYTHRRFGQMGHDRREAAARLSTAQMRRIDDYIREHLAETIGLADLAREAGLSRYHFSRLFMSTVGVSPYQYVLRKRVARAHDLLTGSRLTMAQIALAAGFSSQSHFAEVCRRVLGKTPRDVRDTR